jgi:hypothetical protein
VEETRLITYAELEEHSNARFDVKLRHVVRLPTGREVLLLDDRGLSGTCDPGVPLDRRAIKADARTAVGPDEPVDGQSWAALEQEHWSWIAGVLRVAGSEATAADVGRLPHDVVLGERLLAASA